MARDGSFSCRASALRLPLLGEPVKAGDNLTTIDNPTDASDPCKPETAGASSYGGPIGCYLVRSDPNCVNPNQISLGLLYATTEECRPNTVNPADPASPGPGDLCRSTPGSIDLHGKNAEPVLAGDGVRSRAGVADLFLTDGGKPAPNFLHVSAINAFAEVTCRPNAAGTLVPVYDARSQVVFVNFQLGPLGLGLDLIPGLIPNAAPTEPKLNMYGAIGPIRFNATYVNNNESGLPIGPDEGQPRLPNPMTGIVDLTGDADPSTPAFDPITKVTQRAVDVAGAIIAAEVTVDVTKSPCAPGPPKPDPGKIVVKKFTDHSDQTAFGFEIDPGDLRFNLAGGQQAEFILVAGNYTVTEDANASYTQTVTCVDPSGNTTTAGRTATIALAAGETVTCTYTNSKACPPGTVLKDGKCVTVCPNGKEKPCPKPPKCDRDGDGKDDNDRDRDGKDDRDDDGDGRDDRDGKDLKSGRHDDNGDGRDDECERDRKEGKKNKCSKHSKKSGKKAGKKAAKKSSGKSKDDDDKGKGKDKGDKDDDKDKGDKDDDKGKDKDKGDKDKKGCKSKKSKKAKKSKKR